MSGGGGTGVSGLYGTTTDDRNRTMNRLALSTTPTARSMLLSCTTCGAGVAAFGSPGAALANGRPRAALTKAQQDL